jgi:carbon storage regulator
MLILTRKPGESLYIGDHVKVTIVEIKGNQIRVGIDAPSDLRIYREEIYRQILDENKKAAEGMMIESSLEELSGGWNLKSSGDGASGEKGKRKVGSGMQAQSPSFLVKRKPGGPDKLGTSVDSPEKGEGKKES